MITFKPHTNEITAQLEDGSLWIFPCDGGGVFLSAESSLGLRGVSLDMRELDGLINALTTLRASLDPTSHLPHPASRP